MAKKTKLLTPEFRVSFPSVFKPAAPMKNPDGSPSNEKSKYKLTMIFDPATFTPEDKKRFQAIREAIDEISIEAFKKPLKDIPGARKPFRDGAEKSHLDGYGEGKIFASASSFGKPGVVASDGRTPIQDDEAFYAGCYARASITFYHYDVRGNKGVSFGLQNVMFIKDGERFDNRTDAEEDFGEVAAAVGVKEDYSDMI